MNALSTPEPRRLRLKKLVRPGLQLRLCLWFACVVATAMITQFVFLARAVARFSLELPGDPSVYFDRFVTEALVLLGTSLGIVLPLTVLVGVLATFHIAGPLHRLQSFLDAIRRGETPDDVRLRKGDELKDFAQALNEVTRPLRARGAGGAGGASERSAA